MKPPNRLQIWAKKWSKMLEPLPCRPSSEGMKLENCTSNYKVREENKGLRTSPYWSLTIWLHNSRGKLLICPSSSVSLPLILYAILTRMTRFFWWKKKRWLLVIKSFSKKHLQSVFSNMPVNQHSFQNLNQKAHGRPQNIYSKPMLTKNIIYLSMLVVGDSQILRYGPISSSGESIAASWI